MENEIDLMITDGGESLSIFEIMERFRNDGSCEQMIKNALVFRATAFPSAPDSVNKAARRAAEKVSQITTRQIGIGAEDEWLDKATAIIVAELASVTPAETGWRSIESAPKDGTPLLVGLIRDGRLWRASDARFNRIGWYAVHGGASCHWATHYLPLPPLPLESEDHHG